MELHCIGLAILFEYPSLGGDDVSWFGNRRECRKHVAKLLIPEKSSRNFLFFRQSFSAPMLRTGFLIIFSHVLVVRCLAKAKPERADLEGLLNTEIDGLEKETLHSCRKFTEITRTTPKNSSSSQIFPKACQYINSISNVCNQ